ncbi:MAG: glycosyltransferase family 4 protein [Candidatus Limnocylindria bacterium]
MAERPIVVLVGFEGPDRYSFVGGLATRMNDLGDALVGRGYLVRHLFVGDPSLPAREERLEGGLVLERWCREISARYAGGVYDGEHAKATELARAVPPYLVEEIVGPAAARGSRVVILFEDWQTAPAALATARLLEARGLRAAASLLWNANNTYGFPTVDFPALTRAVEITTISRFMRAELVREGVDPQILPNGIAERFVRPLPPGDARAMRSAFGERPTLVKVARFDPDKRWLWAVDATAALNEGGLRPRLVARGSRSEYAADVVDRVHLRGLSLERIALEAETPPARLAEALTGSTADVALLDFFVPERALRALYAAADGVLANSEREPFGLVGLEVMGSGGVAFLGRTGEDYAMPYGNAVVVQTDDPRELGAHLERLRAAPEMVKRLKAEGRATAKRFVWPRLLDGYEASWAAAERLGR